jgi:5-methyltetrahydrofolate--homocysteine methyltransferase
VGVVLSCNNYEVIDLGVMVPAEKILHTAREQNVDVIGLSGLITPSLDEMVHVAEEMTRQNFELPLLIGGATTSKMHTAVKIAPVYKQAAVHVLDASRSVGVVEKLLNPNTREAFADEVQAEYDKMRHRHQNKRPRKPLLDLTTARDRRFRSDWSKVDIVKPDFLGVKVFDNINLGSVAERIDWTPFFHTWEINGVYPKILDDPVKGEEAKDLFNNAQVMLDNIITNGWLTARAVVGLFPANSDGDDLLLFTDDSRSYVEATFHTLRQQSDKAPSDLRWLWPILSRQWIAEWLIIWAVLP